MRDLILQLSKSSIYSTKPVTGFSEAIWQVIITLAIIISTWYSANYFAALEARRDKRRYLLLAWVVMTILLNFIHLGGG
ncbi:hypothetical protein MN549_21065 [Klebsiella pneumoniae]|uniref:hypothetical protein n=1 Tax=Klebsiella pneumoniae TaxID=573 RepID=UPI0025576BD1|nr:hypothetical protein [Klebsiella pneumoniae]MDK9903962.1 hypothetical protein [Klebsiella pneumoniae]HBU0577884.1 hypothetical protein [Klebsiella pneumoniae]